MKKSIGLRYLKLLFQLIVVGLIVGGCANIVPPSGGPKDIQKPRVKFTEPANYSLHFAAKKVIISFDEFFNLENPAQQIIISPPMTKEPDYVISGKKLIIKLREDLGENTTYNINFGNALKDFNEGNVQDSFRYVFSTGSYIDSGSIKGRVLQAYDNIAVEGFNVLLYKDLSDSVVFKSKPLYVGKTNKDGYFSIENLKKGVYKVIALKDEDFDYQYDPEIEAIAFTDSFIKMEDSTKVNNLILHSFKEEPSKTVLLDVLNPQLGEIKFIYNRPIKTFTFDSDLYNKNDIAIINETKDTICYYYTDYTKKNSVFYVTTNGIIKDTISKDLFFIKESELKDNKLAIKSGAVIQKIQEKQDNTQDLYKHYFITFNRPCTLLDSTKIRLYEDTSKNLVSAHFNIDKKDNRKLEITYNWHAGMIYKVELAEGAVKDIYGIENELLEQTFRVQKAENYGNIILHNNITSDYPFWLKVLNEKGQKVYQAYISAKDKEKTITLTNLLSGFYKVLVIEDLNMNKKWDPGIYLLHKQAEKIYTFGDKIFLKPGWDADIDIVL